MTTIGWPALPDSGVVSEARTTTLIRKAPRAASDVGRSRLADLTRPISREQRIAKNRRPALLLGTIGVIVAGAIGAALFVLPVKTWLHQNDQIEQLQTQLKTTEGVNGDIQQEVYELQTDDGIRAAARSELGYQDLNERRQTIVDMPNVPEDLPDGWPYGPVEQIVTLLNAGQPSGG
jgi:cell division protein FtsL